MFLVVSRFKAIPGFEQIFLPIEQFHRIVGQHAAINIDITPRAPLGGEEEWYRHRYPDGIGQADARRMLERENLAEMGGKIGSHEIDIFEILFFFLAVDIAESRFAVAGFGLNNRAHPVPEKITFVPAKVIDQPFGVNKYAPGIIKEIVEIERPEDFSDFLRGIIQPDQNGHDGSGRGSSYPLDGAQDFPFLQFLERPGVSDSLYTAAFKDQVFEMIGHFFLL
jgi:hypothetical protein